MAERMGNQHGIIDQETNPCKTCGAVCCGPYVIIEFSKDERDFLRSAGTQMISLDDFPAKTQIDGNGFYHLTSKCGFVVDKEGFKKCDAYDDPKRPVICGKFKAGGISCKELRYAREAGIGYRFGY